MNLERVSIAALAHIDAPHRVASSDIDAQLASSMERLGMAPGLLEAVAGIKERRFWAPGVQPSEVAAQAGQLAIETSGIQREQIGILISTSVCRDFIEPSVACLVHGTLGLPDSCINFDLGNACLGFLNGMDVVGAMIERGEIDYGLIVDGESCRFVVESTIERLSQESTTADEFREEFATLTLGSGAVAMVLGRSDLVGDGHRYLGGAKLAASEHNRLCVGQVDRMRTDPQRLMSAGLTLSQKTFEMSRSQLGWSTESIDQFALHQVSQIHTSRLIETVGIDADKCHIIFPEFGNIGPAGVPTVLSKAFEAGRISSGDRVLLAGIGSGINCTAAGVLW